MPSVCARVLQLSELAQKMTLHHDGVSRDLVLAAVVQELHLLRSVWEAVRDSCSELLAPNSHMTGDLAAVASALASDKVRSLWMQAILPGVGCR